MTTTTGIPHLRPPATIAARAPRRQAVSDLLRSNLPPRSNQGRSLLRRTQGHRACAGARQRHRRRLHHPNAAAPVKDAASFVPSRRRRRIHHPAAAVPLKDATSFALSRHRPASFAPSRKKWVEERATHLACSLGCDTKCVVCLGHWQSIFLPMGHRLRLLLETVLGLGLMGHLVLL